MPTVVVNSFKSVLVDGIDAGTVPDVLANKPPGITRIALATALEAFWDERNRAHADALAVRDARIAKLQALVDALGGTTEGLRLARAARRQAALDAQAAAEAEIAAIDSEGTTS